MAPDPRLIGTFEQKSSEDYRYIVTKAGNEFKIEKKNKKSGDATVYKGFLSDVKGTMFMNIYENGSASPSYYLYKVDFSTKGQVKLIGITENVKETFSSSEELKAFIEKYMSLSFFFDKSEDIFIKKG